MIRLTILTAALAFVAACAPPGEGITREEAREQSSKSDELDIDLCLEAGLYGDGEVCDDFCLYPDPDCEGNEFCTDDSTCEEGEHCNAEDFCLVSCDEDGDCDETCIGFCQDILPPCPSILAQVCGRDGKTYSSECNANRAGVDALSTGPCSP